MDLATLIVMGIVAVGLIELGLWILALIRHPEPLHLVDRKR